MIFKLFGIFPLGFPETISVLWYFHRSWHKLPSGSCPWHSTKLPGRVPGGSWTVISCGFLSVAGDGEIVATRSSKSIVLWLPWSFICVVTVLCLAWVSCWGHKDKQDVVFTFHEIIASRGCADQQVQWDASRSVTSLCDSHFQGEENVEKTLNLLGELCED